MRGAGDESALRLPAGLDAVEHRVHHHRQLRYLIMRVRYRHSLTEAIGADRRALSADRLHRGPPSSGPRTQCRARFSACSQRAPGNLIAMTPLIAEDLLWLLHSDDNGHCVIDRAALDPLLAGAVLIELTTPTLVEPLPRAVIMENGRWAAQVASTGHATPGYWRESDPVITDAIARINATAYTPARAIAELGWGLRETLCARLVADGRVRHAHGRILGLVRYDHWPTVDLERKRALRYSLHRALLDCERGDPRTEALLSLLSIVRATGAQFLGRRVETIEARARTRSHRYTPRAAAAAVEAAVFRTLAGVFTGAA